MRAFLTALVTGAQSDDLDLLQRIAPDENYGRYFQPFVVTASLAELCAAALTGSRFGRPKGELMP